MIKMSNKLRNILLVFFSLVFLFSGVMLLREIFQYRKSLEYLNSYQGDYTPDVPFSKSSKKGSNKKTDSKNTDNHSGDTGSASDDKDDADVVWDLNASNPSIQALVRDYPDAVGWLTVAGADISHPFALADDNQKYLRAALDGSYVRSGTVFMDFRCSRDLTDKVNILYGHNLNDGSMFSTLSRYLDTEYILQFPDVFVSLPECTEHYTIWAAYVGDALEDPTFLNVGNSGNIQELVDYIADKAEYIKPGYTPGGEDRLLVLSTCNPSWFYARTVVVCVADR